MALFFDLLPGDLQIWIIHSWLLDDSDSSRQVRVLSALDIACSNRRIRPARLELLERIPPFLDRPARLGIRETYTVHLLNWIASRHLAVRCLLLQNGFVEDLIMPSAATPCLAAMDSLRSLTIGSLCPSYCCWLLKACPNISSLAFNTQSTVAFQNTCVSLADTGQRLTALNLIMQPAWKPTVVDLASLTEALTRHGQSLTSLKLAGITLNPALLDSIAQQCSNVRTLDICAAGLSSGCVIGLANALKQLNCITLDQFSVDEACISEILQGLDHTRIRSVYVGSPALSTTSVVANIHFMIANPNFDSLRFGNSHCAYNHSAKSLNISLYQLNQEELRSILSIVPVTNLTVANMTHMISPEIVSALGSFVGNTVVALTLVNCSDQQHVIALLSKCLHVKSLKFDYKVVFNSGIISVLSNHCKDLISIYLEGSIAPHYFVELLARCCGLTEIKLGHVEKSIITAKMLQAVGDGGTVTTLSWMKRRFLLTEEKLALIAFRKVLKEKQLLPVPRLLMYDSFGVHHELG